VHLPPVVAGIAITFGFLVAGWLTVRSMSSAPGADDISALVVAEDEDQVTTTPSTPSSGSG
jgi:hypothetical protein